MLLPAETILAFRTAQWNDFRHAPGVLLPRDWRNWLLTPGSLTKRLIQATGGDFRIQVLKHEWGYAWPSEQLALGLRNRQRVLIREVAMICQGQPWVAARTLIPAHTLTGPNRRLKSLGETPLGAYLFQCRSLQRSPLQIAPLRSSSASAPEIWGRRSIFYVENRPLLVSEFFLPAILEMPARLSSCPQHNS